MQKLLIGFLFGMIISACASSIILLKESERTYFPDKNTPGKWLWYGCTHKHWITGNCDTWGWDSLDSSAWETVVDRNLRLVPESRIQEK